MQCFLEEYEYTMESNIVGCRPTAHQRHLHTNVIWGPLAPSGVALHEAPTVSWDVDEAFHDPIVQC